MFSPSRAAATKTEAYWVAEKAAWLIVGAAFEPFIQRDFFLNI